MSHFSNIKTKIRNLDFLKAALNDLDVDWKDGLKQSSEAIRIRFIRQI